MASLDPLARREFLQDLMEAIAEQELSVVLSSHLIADLERVCDYLILLVGSRVRVAGPGRVLLLEGQPPPLLTKPGQPLRRPVITRYAATLTAGPLPAKLFLQALERLLWTSRA